MVPGKRHPEPRPGRCAAGRRHFLKTREKPTGGGAPSARARNQAHEPRRRDTRAGTRTGARAGYARNRDPLPVGARRNDDGNRPPPRRRTRRTSRKAAMPAERLAPAASADAKAAPTQPPPQAGEELSGGARPAFLQAGREEFGPSPFFSPPAGREGPGAGLSARRGVAGLRPPLPLARKRAPTRPPPQAGEEVCGGGLSGLPAGPLSGQLHARNGYSI